MHIHGVFLIVNPFATKQFFYDFLAYALSLSCLYESHFASFIIWLMQFVLGLPLPRLPFIVRFSRMLKNSIFVEY